MSQKIFLIPIALLVILVFGGCGFDSGESIEKNVEQLTTPIMDAKERVEEFSIQIENKNKGKQLDIILTDAPSVTLKDVTGGAASGTGWIVIKEGRTFHRVIGKNLPKLEKGDFYEGWLIKFPVAGEFFSTGKMIFDESRKQWILEYEADGDKSEYRSVVITLEADDENSDPSKHVIEGRFPDNVNLEIR